MISKNTGKGHVAAPSAETRPAAISKAQVSQAEMPTGKLLEAQPLPTRTRSRTIMAPEAAWAALLATLASFPEAPAAVRLGKELAKGPWTDMNVQEVHNVYTSLDSVYGQTQQWKPYTHELYAAQIETMGLLTQFLVGTQGTLAAMLAADQIRKENLRYRTHGVCWDDPVAVATRLVLPGAPEAEYDMVVTWCLVQHDDPVDWQRQSHFAFMLGDDRPARHALQPLAVLRAAAAAGIDVPKERMLLPLLLDVPPSLAAEFMVDKEPKLFFSCVDGGTAAATAIDVACAHGESALPTLSWMLPSGTGNDRTMIAAAMLETRAPEALAALLPLLQEKAIRKAVNDALKAYPADMFRQCLNVAAASRSEPFIRARVMEAIAAHGADTARAWAAGMDDRVLQLLQTLIDGPTVALAPEADLPDVLRSPPWRRRSRQGDDIVLTLTPIATPFRYPADTRAGQVGYLYRYNRAIVVPDMAKLAAFLPKFNAMPEYASQVMPLPDEPIPDPSAPGDVALAWLSRRLTALSRMPSPILAWLHYDDLYRGLERQPDDLALMLWELTGPLLTVNMEWMEWNDMVPAMLRRFGERALPGLLQLLDSNPGMIFRFATAVDAPGIAPVAARALLKLKKVRIPAIDWLRRHRRTAMLRLIPDAVGKPGAAREAAEYTLRWYAAEQPEGREALDACVGEYAATSPQVVAAVAQGLGRDPLARFPARIAKLPGWLSPQTLTRPLLRATGAALPDTALIALLEMLAFSTPNAVYAGIPLVRSACTADSLGMFAWDLFSAWLVEGAPAKDGWAMRAVGWLGNDDCARRLTQLIRKWPGEGGHARAVTGLDVLMDIGSDIALMNLNGIATKLKFKPLQEKAREKISAIAEARDLTPEELADRLAPDLDLDARGGLDLDFGPRRFRVGFDELLRPWVKDDKGARLKDLPKPNKADAAEQAAAAVARWEAVKKDARAVAAMQLARLETMLTTSRRVKPEVFRTFFATHPLLRNLTRRLVWGLYDDTVPLTPPKVMFRVTEELGVTDATDNALDLDMSSAAPGLIGLVHPLTIGQAAAQAWGTLFGEYEITQPFPQLGRETFAFTEAEAAASEIARFQGVKVDSKRLRGMTAHGWPLGAPQNSGVIHWLEREVTLADGRRMEAMLGFRQGLVTGAPEYEDKAQTLDMLRIGSWSGKSDGRCTFGDLDAITASEMLRGLSGLAAV